MEDVAREAKVARVTVSRVLNEPDKVKPTTRKVVLEAIRRLGYVPDRVAGSLASRRSGVIGAIVPSLSNAWFADTMDGLAETLAESGFQLMLGQSRYRLEEEEALAESFIGRRVDALVLTGVHHMPSLVQRLRQIKLPVVETWELTTDPIDCVVGFSNFSAGKAVGEHLWRSGRRHIGFIGAHEKRAVQRLEGLQDSLQKHGASELNVELVEPPSAIHDGSAKLGLLLERCPDLDAVFCSNDTLAVGALFECQKRHRAVPNRLAIVGFSDLPIASACIPSLTTVRVPARNIGVAAGHALLKRLTTPNEASAQAIDLGFELITRESA
jgi:LacI family transcriptional regulator, gluconate utilization system Gnt-I transcriptional repressor